LLPYPFGADRGGIANPQLKLQLKSADALTNAHARCDNAVCSMCELRGFMAKTLIALRNIVGTAGLIFAGYLLVESIRRIATVHQD
jgi:hypothetical protein